MKKFVRFLTTFVTNFIILFAITIIAKMAIDILIFSQRTMTFKYIYIEAIVIALSAILLTFFYQINMIHLMIQILVTYIVFLFDVYFFGLITGWFKAGNLIFILISVLFNLVGLGLLSLIIFIRMHHQQNILNQNLKKYKENDQHEEN